MEQKELNETLFTKALETQHNAFLWVGVAPEFIMRPNFLTSNSR
ncbi:hypothetical protein LEP1GSC186_0209 [Leptospira noguchii serovar Autumnalis str. ZUN142]|uniref:Uncharacterized protein n=1 Tax=Leptospira noguchii serovar Autumnalis str. ZUN142 TaxID=1085540 RepID=M6U7D5_9LEPT|nr:hypothetical protein LEP1GSC186_0209 [Leptospira noguchii serovar Autumnalis str. ZUN142]